MHAAKSSVGGFPSVGNFSRQRNADKSTDFILCATSYKIGITDKNISKM